MRFNDPQKPTSARGIIILDSSALVPLALPLPQEYKLHELDAEGQEIKLCSMLAFLARNGYEVIIPEMVALEFGIVRNGFAKDDVFEKINFEIPLYIGAKNFLMHVPRFKGNIYIAPPADSDQSPAAVYARQIWAVFSRRDSLDVEKSADAKRKSYSALDRMVPVRARKDFGDFAAFELVRGMPKPDVPVFYLSEDWRAQHDMRNVRSDISVKTMHVLDLYEAMLRRELLHSVGIASISLRDMFGNLSQELIDLNPQQRPYLWQSQYEQADPTFYFTLTGLDEELEIPKARDLVPQHSARNKFYRKFGPLGALVPGKSS